MIYCQINLLKDTCKRAVQPCKKSLKLNYNLCATMKNYNTLLSNFIMKSITVSNFVFKKILCSIVSFFIQLNLKFFICISDFYFNCNDIFFIVLYFYLIVLCRILLKSVLFLFCCKARSLIL